LKSKKAKIEKKGIKTKKKNAPKRGTKPLEKKRGFFLGGGGDTSLVGCRSKCARIKRRGKR